MENFTAGRSRYEDIEELKPGLFIANIYYGLTAKVPNPTIFKMGPNDPEPTSYCGWITRPKGWRREAGYWDAALLPGDSERILVETKDRARAIEIAIRLAKEFL